MRWPFRRRRHDVGRYVAPPEAPPAPVRRVLDDGVLIAKSAVRLSLANDILVATLRDDAAPDRAGLEQAARRILLEIANQKHDAAARTERARRLRAAEGRRGPVEDEEHRRAPQLQRLLAVALRSVADDPEAVDALVEEARVAAWQQLAAEIARKAEQRTAVAPLDGEARAAALAALADDLRAELG